jgi:outer membrane protein assembly factor BamD
MTRRTSVVPLLALAWFFTLLFTVGCTNKKVQNPLANINSKQPDKVLFDRALDALKHNRYDVARLTLQTLINTYPDSEYIARAKLGVADSWYVEGGSTALTQAEIEYKDFITFFPNMPEAAEAQYKIANIHYQQMEKPDRDFTHAARAEDEYRQMILQFPDSKLVPEAKQRLREVQEMLGEREFRIGRFYYMRQSYPAGIARLRSVVEKYPLYSRADEALYLLGQSYEGEIENARRIAANEVVKAKFIESAGNDAAKFYQHLIERYPLAPRAEDAKDRLAALHKTVPTPTPDAIARNKEEIASRESVGMMDRLMGQFRKHPETALANHVGEPTLIDPTPVSATEVARAQAQALIGAPSGSSKVSVETVKSPDGSVTPDPNAVAPPSSTNPGPSEPATPNPYGELKPETSAAPEAQTPAPADQAATPAASGSMPAPAPAPPQSNDLGNAQAGSQAPAVSSSGSQDNSVSSSSRAKKKKGLKKIIPF